MIEVVITLVVLAKHSISDCAGELVGLALIADQLEEAAIIGGTGTMRRV